ncbi:hypothetical protein BJX68DRAFT_250307 [Aspergillus pseudodeflectus]|uniref:C2H2 finger domain protein n=1 Tax=Aspergillus pseudodeflectus TaxID=176178 RepID=A0ABR4J9X0_9EURO
MMKRTRARQNRSLRARSDCSENDVAGSSTDSDDQCDATYETDVTEPDISEPDHSPSPRKRLRSDENHPVLEPSVSNEADEFDNDPLDDTGIDLCEIDEDFDKAGGTIERRERIESRWKRYCNSKIKLEPNVQKWRDPEEALRQASNNDLYRFLGWSLKLERGKDGRRNKGIHKSSSLNTDWKNLRGYYQKLTKIKIDDKDGSEVRRGIKYLVVEHGLDTQPKKKTPVYIEDIGPLNETILSTQQKKFYLGFQRVQVCVFNALALFTVHRRSALLSLQFKDLQISLQKDPRGGPPIPLVELTPDGCKKFLGLTKLTTFALPEVVYGPSLVICPHTLLFGVLFHAKAFRNNLTSKAQLRKLFVSKGCQQLLVPLDRKKADWYVFCKTELVKGIPTIQRTQPMSKSSMSSLLVTFGEIRGWPGAFHAHQFRYGGGKVINESGWVSKEQHMLIMKHASPRTFLNHYHPLEIDTDMIRVICGLDPDVELMRAVTRQNRWQDPRRPRYLTERQRAQVEDHPELEEARRKLKEIGAQYDKTQKPGLLPRIERQKKEVRNTRKRLLRALRHQIRENFDEEQAFLDIQAQLAGTAVKEEDEEEDEPFEDAMPPPQLHLLQCLLSFPISNSLEDEWSRRDAAADAVMQYCDVLEGGPLRGRPRREITTSSASETPMAQPPDVPQVQDSVSACEIGPATMHGKPSRATKEYLENSEQPEACFQCFANKKLPDKVRCRMFHDAGCVTRHFDAIHLKEEPLKCNWCEVTLLHKMAFQRHAIDEHRVRSRWRRPDPEF